MSDHDIWRVVGRIVIGALVVVAYLAWRKR